MYSNKNILIVLLIVASLIVLINGSINCTHGTEKSNVEKKSNDFVDLSGRIVNGTKATIEAFPQQVSLRRRYSQSHFCGGNIIAPSWILSAAHCMLTEEFEFITPFSVIIIAGEAKLKHSSFAHQWREVSEIIVHPKFNNETLDYDVALLQLKEPLEYDDIVRPLPFLSNDLEPGTLCQVSGWGYQSEEVHVISGQLLYVNVTLLSPSLCRTLQYVPKGSLCAGYLEGQRDACKGDSGGGLICDGFLTGIVSGGWGCARPMFPGLYADIKFHMPWITEIVDTENNFNYSMEYARGRNNASPSHRPFYMLSLLFLLKFIY